MNEEYEALIHFLYIAPVGLAQTTADGEIAMMNPIGAQLLMPLSRDGGLTNLFTALQDVAPDLRHLASSYEQSSGTICDALRIQLNAGMRGKADPQILSLTLLKLDAGRLMAVLNDVSQQVKRERLLRQHEAWLNAIMTGVTDYALVSLDVNGSVDAWNDSIGRTTGFTAEAVLGNPYSLFYPADSITVDRVLDRLHEADVNGWSLDEGWRRKADGTRFWGSAAIFPLKAPLEPSGAGSTDSPLEPDPGYCLIIRDITEKREASESLRKSTACDHLTGVANRRAFFEAAEIEIARWQRSPRPLSLIIFDADHFKSVNDQYGHPAGDAVLRHLAATLMATFRECDIVARIGGEEFAVLLPSTALAAAVAVAKRFVTVVESQAVVVDGMPINYTVSGGVASMDAGTSGLDALIQTADRALYAAKRAGRNQVAF